jgi:tetratricopeptide (TPR) repeat protein
MNHFRRAIDLDPDYAQAYAGISQTYFFLGVFGAMPSDVSFPEARSSARKALELDDTLAAAHNALAAVHILYDWDWARAEVECRKAIELNPGDPVGYVHLADYMSIQGCHDQAITTFRHALSMDPISRVYLGHFALILYRARQYDQAIQQCRKALDIDPNYANAMWFMALSLEKVGQVADSISVLQKAVEVSAGGMHYMALLGRAHGLAGEREMAQAILDDLEARRKTKYISPFDLALVHFRTWRPNPRIAVVGRGLLSTSVPTPRINVADVRRHAFRSAIRRYRAPDWIVKVTDRVRNAERRGQGHSIGKTFHFCSCYQRLLSSAATRALCCSPLTVRRGWRSVSGS